MERLKKLTNCVMGFLFLGTLSYLSAEINLTEIVKKISPSVVLIRTYSKEGKTLAQGSGFFVSKSGDIITNYHVMIVADSAEVKTSEGKVYIVKEVLAEDKEGDLIRLSVDIPRSAVQALTISGSPPEIAEHVIVVGSPLGLEQTVSDGIVSAIREVKEYGKMIQITAPISEGSSGSPVVNDKGEVIGVASATLGKGQNLNFAVPSERITELTLDKGKTLTEWNEERIQQWRSSAEGLYFSGLIEFYVGDYDSALVYLYEALKKNPNYAEAYVLIGDCKIELSHQWYWGLKTEQELSLPFWNEALEAYKRAVEIDSNSADAYFGLGRVYSRFYSDEEALREYQKSISIKPSARTYDYIGMTYHKMAIEEVQSHRGLGDFDEELRRKMIKAYKQAILLDSNYTDAYYHLGVTYFKSACYFPEDMIISYRKAIGALEAVILIDPNYSHPFTNCPCLYCGGIEWRKAIGTKEPPDIYLELAEVYVELGNSYMTRGRYYEAMDAYEEAIRIKPDFADAYVRLGRAYYYVELDQEALRLYNKAIKLDPNNAGAYFWLGCCYVTMGDRVSAWKVYRTLKELETERGFMIFTDDLYKYLTE